MTTQHTIKIEDLSITATQADAIEQVIRDFLGSLGHSRDSYSLECRPRDGFFPFSHNKGGLEAYAYRSVLHLDYTGFPKVDKIMDKFYKDDEEDFLKSKGLPKNTEYWNDDDLLSEFDEFRESSCEDLDIMFNTQVMITGDNTCTLTMDVVLSDAPYYRKIDDRYTCEIKFKDAKDLAKKLEAKRKLKFVSKFENELKEAY